MGGERSLEDYVNLCKQGMDGIASHFTALVELQAGICFKAVMVRCMLGSRQCRESGISVKSLGRQLKKLMLNFR